MKLLVVGAGYLGEEILRRGVVMGWDVVGASFGGGGDLLACDVSDRGSVEQLPDADAVVHCAASGKGGVEAYKKVYVRGMENLVERYPEARLVFTSSSSVYAQEDGEIVTEESEAQPTRDTGEMLRRAERVTLGGGGVVARLAGLYGPGRSILLRKFLSGEAVIEGEGDRFINMIHRDDAAKAVLHLLGLKDFPSGEIFNVADTEMYQQGELYAALAEKFGRALPPSGPRDLNRKRGWTNKRVSNEKLRGMGWNPQFPDFIGAISEGGEVLAAG